MYPAAAPAVAAKWCREISRDRFESRDASLLPLCMYSRWPPFVRVSLACAARIEFGRHVLRIQYFYEGNGSSPLSISSLKSSSRIERGARGDDRKCFLPRSNRAPLYALVLKIMLQRMLWLLMFWITGMMGFLRYAWTRVTGLFIHGFREDDDYDDDGRRI
ncbi:hypothetical protein DBV15_05389 [Temnothorax longispinosus]|uniref:Uncharacterized protein n=1 Tax=Temnothorax longispinosus TaxID=300112 RepID=A0A4S2JB48_9HYME|nr:hypothetical protein DBV15_05389 [Temnothorax longispinosus]